VRLTQVTEKVALVDLGRVEVLFYLGAPVAALDWCGKRLHAADAPPESEAGVWIEKMASEPLVVRSLATREDIEKFIVLAFKTPTPMVGPPGPKAP